MNKITVGISEAKFSNSTQDTIVTYALGSCIGVVVYDPKSGVGGMLHYMLPLSNIAPDKAKANPYMFGDVGIPQLFQQVYAMGARKENLLVYVAGGARVIEGEKLMDIGQRNILICRKLFWKNNILIQGEATGDIKPRTMYLDMSTGKCWIVSKGETHYF
jgi:chemotaxis protein CheD